MGIANHSGRHVWLYLPCHWVMAAAVLALSVATAPPLLGDQRLEFFEGRIRPVLVEQCYACHNSATAAEGGLALDYRDRLLRGGDSGPAVDQDNPRASLLLQAIRHEGELQMPQDGAKLSPQVVEDFTRWLTDGTFDPRDEPPSGDQIAALTSWESILDRRKKWWSFQPIANPDPPIVQNRDWSSHPVDQFVLAKLEVAGLQPTSWADRQTLIRRLSFTLTGLPPTVAEVEAFVADESPDAYERLVDRLLDSPHFGERWARHWMDWFRYAESHGSEGDPLLPHAWRYRDYLIRALNDDVPYNQMVREHIAGDLLANPRVDPATGFNESAMGTSHYRFTEHGYAPTDAGEELVRTTDNQIDVLSKALLGMTVSCARCHDHKFDAISQQDFYAFYGVLVSCRPAMKTVDSAERQSLHKAELRGLKTTIQSLLANEWLAAVDHLTEQLATAPPPPPPEVRGNKKAAETLGEWQRRMNEAALTETSPLHAWAQIRGASDEQLAETWQQLVEQWGQSRARLNRRREIDYPIQWDLSTSDSERWYSHGSGTQQARAPAGAFHLALDDDRVVANIYPSGVYSHLLSTKHSGQLSSPAFKVESESVCYRGLGSHGNARYVMSNYPRTSGPIYDKHKLDGDEFQWRRWDMTYWKGDEAHLEFATARDVPVEAGNPERSWFGIAEVVAVSAGQTPPRDEPAEFNSPLFEVAGTEPLTSPAKLAEWYGEAVRRCIMAWRDGEMTDEEARFLSFFVRLDMLPNHLASLEEIAPLLAEYRRLEAQIPVPTRAPGILEAGAADQPVFIRGNHKQPGEMVPRRFLEAIDPVPYDSTGSGRLELAMAITDRENPLTSRVIVNRIWHHLFGRGIVATPDNLGRMGELPTHPELLDYLATRFVADGQSMKQMLRLLLTSETYRLDSTPLPDSRRTDPDDQWLSHMRVRRLEAEAVRDAMLAVSGRLDRTMFGPPVDGDVPRRSVYVRIYRNSLDPFLSAFDAPPPFSTVGRRDVTNVPAQSLTLMNGRFAIDTAQAWGNRLVMDNQLTDDRTLIEHFFQEALSRPPTSEEVAATNAYLEELRGTEKTDAAWRDVGHAILQLKEFIYVR